MTMSTGSVIISRVLMSGAALMGELNGLSFPGGGSISSTFWLERKSSRDVWVGVVCSLAKLKSPGVFRTGVGVTGDRRGLFKIPTGVARTGVLGASIITLLPFVGVTVPNSGTGVVGSVGFRIGVTGASNLTSSFTTSSPPWSEVLTAEAAAGVSSPNSGSIPVTSSSWAFNSHILELTFRTNNFLFLAVFLHRNVEVLDSLCDAGGHGRLTRSSS
ncbi:hypothetical protein BZA05DRAFT_406302 [Tricharina praecox]|uniref:uncharacterized protein n=1 Tax=Tricharina praecox TaxID=43433 RepID=UPI00221F409B|nr:uncharacterized protein BZA05DRAFT_406302 [Tricharina praecox]KAI5846686.1 hypothetical protein BZA05DRAFT_406302 [Tricharina praecox]